MASPQQSGAGASAPSNAGALDFMRLVNRGKWHILAGIVLGMVGGYIYYLRTPPMYRSYGQLFLQAKASSSELMAAAQGGSAFMSMADDHALTSQLTTYALVFSSPAVVRKALENKESGIDALPSFKADAGAAVGQIMTNLSAERVMDRGVEPTRILRVSYASLDAKETGVVLRAVVDAFADYVEQSNRKGNQQRRDTANLYSQRLVKDRGVLEAKLREKGLVFEGDQVAGGVPALAPPANGQPAAPPITSRMFQNAERDEAAANELFNILRNRQLETERILKAIEDGNARKERPAIILQALRTLELQRAESDASVRPGQDPFTMAIMDAQSRISELEAQGKGSGHQDMKSAFNRLRNLQDFQDVSSAALGGAEPEQLLKKHEEVGRARAAILPRAIEDQRKYAVEATRLADQVRARKAEMQSLRELIANLDKQIEIVENQKRGIDLELGSGVRVEVMSPPGDGVAQSILVRSLQLGAVLGLLIGLLAAYLFEVSDQSFRSAEEIQQTLGVKLLGHVSTFRPARPGEEQAVPDGGAAPDSSLVTFYRPKARIAEDYRAVRTALLYGLGGDARKVLQVTSPNPGDGKSTLCANLAVAIARTGKKVVLVDVDWRRPRVEKIFNLDNRQGVTNVLRGEIALDDAMQASCVEHLTVLPCGLPKPENPAEMLVAPSFAQLVEELRRRFDYVLLDTPPVLAVSDPCSVAPLADGVVLTININTRSRADAVRAAEQLEDVGAKVVGVVVNRVAAVVGYGDYGYQGYSYGTEYYNRSNAYYTDDEVEGRARPRGAATNGTAVPNGAAATGAFAAATNGTPRQPETPRPPGDPPRPAGAKAEVQRPPSSMEDLLRGLRQKFGDVPTSDGQPPAGGGAA